MAPADDSVLGVGIDVEELTRFEGLPEKVVGRAAERWLSPAERAWWRRQPCAEASLVVVLSCKEAAFKAGNHRRAAHEVQLDLDGDLASGRAVSEEDGVAVLVEWRRWEDRVVALAVAAPRGERERPDQPAVGATGLSGSPTPNALPTFRIATRIFRDFGLSFGSP